MLNLQSCSKEVQETFDTVQSGIGKKVVRPTLTGSSTNTLTAPLGEPTKLQSTDTEGNDNDGEKKERNPSEGEGELNSAQGAGESKEEEQGWQPVKRKYRDRRKKKNRWKRRRKKFSI